MRTGPVLILSSWWPRQSSPYAFPFIVDHAQAVSTAFGDVECWSIEPGLRPLPDRPLAAALSVERKRPGIPWRVVNSSLGPAALFEAGRVEGRSLAVAPAMVIAQCFEHSGAYAAGLASSSGAPLVYVEHWSAIARGTLLRRQLAAFRAVVRRSASVLAAGQFLASAMERVGGLAPGTVQPIDNPVDVRTFIATPPTPRSGTVIAQVADFRPVKGHDLLADALTLAGDDLRRAGVRFVLVGDGPARPAIEARLRSEGNGDLATFTGKLSRARVAEVIAAADWTLLTSESENLPCVVIESLAVGRPVAAPRVGGIPELIAPPDGLVYERTSESLAGTLRTMGAGAVAGLRPWYERAEAAAGRYRLESVARTYADLMARSAR